MSQRYLPNRRKRVFFTFVPAVRPCIKNILLWIGLSLWLLSCQQSPARVEEKQNQNNNEAPQRSITAQVAESLARDPVVTPPPMKTDSIQKKAQTLPPPKKEPWMDTLTDLTGFPAPNAATLLSEDPTPLNKPSVEILIASQFRNRKPEELILRVYVSEQGTVLRYQLLKSSHPKLGPEYFVRPLLELRFNPARQNEKSVAAWTTIRLQIPSGL